MTENEHFIGRPYFTIEQNGVQYGCFDTELYSTDVRVWCDECGGPAERFVSLELLEDAEKMPDAALVCDECAADRCSEVDL
jgi:hypothetical protein